MKPNPHLIAEAWEKFHRQVLPATAPAAQHDGMRYAFYAGAYDLFRTLMAILDPGTEPTARDLAQMTALDDELEAWRAEVLAKFPTQGPAA